MVQLHFDEEGDEQQESPADSNQNTKDDIKLKVSNFSEFDFA